MNDQLPFNQLTPNFKKGDNILTNTESHMFSETKLMTTPTKPIISEININSYENAIKLVKSIKQYKLPFDKMTLIAKISQEITEAINNYWKDMSNIISNTLLNIDADELMTLYIYIIIKSQMSEILVHSKFIKEFTTNTTKSTMLGYYFTTLEASLMYISEIKEKEDLNRIDKSSFIRSIKSFSERCDISEINRSSLFV
jgi:hypothetical protein